MAAVCELVSALDGELVRLGYKPSTMVWYRGCWRRLERYFASRGAQEFSLDVAVAWVDEACGGFFEKEQAGVLKATDVYVFRVAAMLDDFAVHGAVLRRYCRSVGKLSAEQADVLAGFQAWLRANGCAVSTVRAYGTVAGEFLAFTGTRGGLGGLDGAVIGAFVATLAGYQPKTVEHKLCAVRSLLRFATADGLIDEAVLGTVPAVRSVRQARIPSVWEAADVAKVLDAIDRANPSGKRDYAIVLVICRLGLRAVDVKRFKLLICYLRDERSIPPERLTLDLIDVDMITAFVAWLRADRHNSPSTCNQRLAAISSFFSWLQTQDPARMACCQDIIQIPSSKHDQPAIAHLTVEQTRQLLALPDRCTRQGRRDATLLATLYDTAARVQELADLRVRDIRLQDPAMVALTGKGRKTRHVPIDANTTALLAAYLAERQLDSPGRDHRPVFFNQHHAKLTRGGIAWILRKYQAQATDPQLAGAQLSPHVLRHGLRLSLR